MPTVCRRRPSRGSRMSSGDRKSTRLNSSHSQISYAVFCLKKKKTCVQFHVLLAVSLTATQPRRHPASPPDHEPHVRVPLTPPSCTPSLHPPYPGLQPAAAA